jgi:hypothetical protein
MNLDTLSSGRVFCLVDTAIAILTFIPRRSLFLELGEGRSLFASYNVFLHRRSLLEGEGENGDRRFISP